MRSVFFHGKMISSRIQKFSFLIFRSIFYKKEFGTNIRLSKSKSILALLIFTIDLSAIEYPDHPEHASQKPGTIVIRAHRPGNSVQDTTDSLDLARPGLADSTSRFLEKAAGTIVNRTGAPGSDSTLAIRSASASSTGVFLAGIDLSDPDGTPANLESLPFEIFSTIEIVKSFSPANLPGTYPGGAINLIPRNTKNEHQAYVSGTTSTLGSGSLSGTLLYDNMLFFARAAGSANSYTYFSDNGTTGNTLDDAFLRRENEDYKEGGATALLQNTFEIEGLSLLIDGYFRERGLPGPTTQPAKSVRLQEQRATIDIGHRQALTGKLHYESHLGFTTRGTLLRDPDRELATGLESERRLLLRPRISFIPFFQIPDFRIQFPLLTDYAYLERENDFLAARANFTSGITVEQNILSNWVRYSIQGKIDNYFDSFNPSALNRSPIIQTTNNKNSELVSFPSGAMRVGLLLEKLDELWHKNILQGMEVFVLLAASERIPNLTESYGNGSTILPSNGLSPEFSLTNSAGLELRRNLLDFDIKMSATWFLIGQENAILYLANTQRTSIATNVGRAQSEGVDTELQISLPDYFFYSIRYSYLEARDRSRIPFYFGKYLPNRPRHSLYQSVEFYLPYQLTFLLEHDFRGNVYLDRFNTSAGFITSRHYVHSGIKWKINNFDFQLAVRNLGNELIADILGFPLPGRYFEFTCKAALL